MAKVIEYCEKRLHMNGNRYKDSRVIGKEGRLNGDNFSRNYKYSRDYKIYWTPTIVILIAVKLDYASI